MSISRYSTANTVSQRDRKGQFQNRAFRTTHQSWPDWLLMTIVTLLRNPPGEPSELTPYMTANITSILLRLMDGLKRLFANNKRIYWPSGNRRISDTEHTRDGTDRSPVIIDDIHLLRPGNLKWHQSMMALYNLTRFYTNIKMYLPWAVIAIQWTWLIVNGYCYVIASIGKIMPVHRGSCSICLIDLIVWGFSQVVALVFASYYYEVCSDDNIWSSGFAIIFLYSILSS